MSIDIDELSSAVSAELTGYSKEVEKKMSAEIDRMSQLLVESLKNDPIIPVKTGKYKKGFYFKTLAAGPGYKRNIIGNKIYQLTHLLERGHLKKGGSGRTKAFPHWETAQRKAEELLEQFGGDL